MAHQRGERRQGRSSIVLIHSPFEDQLVLFGQRRNKRLDGAPVLQELSTSEGFFGMFFFELKKGDESSQSAAVRPDIKLISISFHCGSAAKGIKTVGFPKMPTKATAFWYNA